MRRNDWSYTCYLTVEGYYEGFRADTSVGSPGATPNGHNYDFNFTNCKHGIAIDYSSYTGIMFTNVTTENCEVGVDIRSTSTEAVQIINSSLDASRFAIRTDEKATSELVLTSSTIERGNVYIKGGTLLASDCDFNNPSPQIFFGTVGTGSLSGNRAKNQPLTVESSSIYSYTKNDAPVDIPEVPTIQAVSYTHLDVYKRQLAGRAD